MAELADNIFRETFANLREAFSIQSSAVKSPLQPRDDSAARASYDRMSDLLATGLTYNAKARLEHLRSLKKNHAQHLLRTYQKGQLASKSVQVLAEYGTDKCRAHMAVTLDALAVHEDESNRRLAELVLDIIGEYSKSFLRANRRYDLVSIADCKTMALLVMQLRWKRFIYKFLSVVAMKVEERKKGTRAAITGESLSISDNEAEVSMVLDALKRRLNSAAAKQSLLTAVVRFERVRDKDRANVNPNMVPITASTLDEFSKFEAELISWISPPPRSAGVHPGIGRARSVSNIASDKERPSSRLHEFLHSSKVEWLCPASHSPHIWDDILDEEAAEKPALYSGDNSSVASEGISERMHFSKKFSLQHTAGVASNRLYFCLEERYLWSKSPGALSVDGSDEQKYPVLALLSYLQSIYARRSAFSDDGVLAAELNGVLDVFEFVGDHRDLRTTKQAAGSKDGDSSHSADSNITFVDLASIFPDIVRAKTRSGFVVHFAPAIMASLLECEAAQAMDMSSDYIRHICVESKCPHPWLISLLSTGGTQAAGKGGRNWPISKLYALSGPNHMPARGRAHQSLQSQLMNTMAPTTASIDTTAKLSADLDEAISDAAKNCLFLVPMSPVCLKELFLCYFGEDRSVSHDGIEKNVGDEHFGNAAYILPDHSRLYYTSLKQKGILPGNSADRSSFVIPSCDHSGTFHHSYVLLAIQTISDQRKPPAASVGKYTRDTIDSMISAADSGVVRAQENWRSGRQNKAPEQNPLSGSKVNTNVDTVKYYMLQFCRDADCNQDMLLTKTGNEGRPSLAPGHQMGSSSLIRYNQWTCDQLLFDTIMKESDSHEVMLSRNESRVSVSSSTVDAGPEAEQRRGWDPSVISSLCRWRACLCEASVTSTPRYLCSHHAEVKKILDHLAAHGMEGSMYDSCKYLPKKAPTIPMSLPDRDLQIIRMASPLLQDLRDGKLGHIVHSSVRRMVQDMPLRHRISSAVDWYNQRLHAAAFFTDDWASSGSANPTSKLIKQRKNSFLATAIGKHAVGYLPTNFIPPPPAWAQWKNTDALRRL